MAKYTSALTRLSNLSTSLTSKAWQEAQPKPAFESTAAIPAFVFFKLRNEEVVMTLVICYRKIQSLVQSEYWRNGFNQPFA